MLDLQIKILYCTYGWTPKEIAKLLEIPLSAVNISIENQELTQPSEEGIPSSSLLPLAASTPSTLPMVLPASPDGIMLPDERSPANTMSAILDVETGKQREIAPIISVIEILLLDKVMKAARALEPEDVRQMGEIVNTFKRLTQDAVINNVTKIVKDDGKNTNNTNVCVQLLSFKEH